MIPISELDLIKIGEIVKAHGFKGEAVIKLSTGFENLKETEHLFLEIEGLFVPFFYSYKPKTFKKSSLIVKFNNLDSELDVKNLIKCSVFTTTDSVIPEEVNLFETLAGYDIYNNEIYIGIAGDYLNIPSNPILTVTSKTSSEILIPINEEFVLEIDETNRKIIFNLPEGLIDVNS